MKCTNCGHEMPDNSKFCEMCGAPIDSELTQLAEDDFPADLRADGNYHDNVRDDFNSFNSFENSPMPGDYPGGYPDDYPNDYPNDGYSGQRFTDRDADYRRDYNGGPVYRDPYGNNRGRKPRMSNQKKAIIISVIALVLVVAILGGVIYYVSRVRVSATELEEAKENYIPPAEAIAIDTSLDDPSDESIRFEYDGRGRISSCSYAVNDKTYDQSYTYDDNNDLITIDTKYRNHAIFTKEIEYGRVSESNVFEAIDGYYVRMDDKSLGRDSDSTSSVSDDNKSSDSVTSKNDSDEPEKPNSKTAEATKPLERYQELYINFLDNTSISYSSGTLIYLNDDDTPELILWSSGSEVPYYICYISNDKVQTYGTADSHSLEYSERGGYFTTGTYDQTGYIYYFNGSSVSKEHTYSFSYANDDFRIDNEQMTQEDYFNAIDTVYLKKETKKDASNDPHDKSSLQEYIRNY